MYYWQATLKDGTIVRETDDVEHSRETWKSIEPDVHSLLLIGEGQVIALPSGSSRYQQGKGASADLNGNNFRIESHWIRCGLNFGPDGEWLQIRVFPNSKRIITEITY